jgi:phosphonate transport system substrate-binding protein
MKGAFRLVFIFSILGIAGLLASEWRGQDLVIALKPDKDPESMLRERESLQSYLAERLGAKVRVVIPLSSAVIIEGLANGSIDAGYLSSTDMIHVADSGAGKLLLAGELNGKTTYDSYWVVKKESPYQGVEDLRGRPVAFASRSSTSGYLFPLRDLVARGLVDGPEGLESFFGAGNVWFGSGYVSAVQRVLMGEAEAAAVSYYVLDEENHLPDEQRAELRRLQSQGPVPTHVIATSRHLQDPDLSSLRNALLSLNEPGQESLRDQLFTSKLVVVDQDHHLQPVREALHLASKSKP